MEFATDGLLRVRITADDVGKRVSVRSLTGSDQGAGKFTDTIGVLTSWTHGVLSITRRNGERVQIAESLLVAGKVAPPTPARRRGLPSADLRELTVVAARGWPPIECERLGDWQLRSAASPPQVTGPATGSRTGFTRRANSALALGDPGLPLDDALAKVTDWYRARGLPAYLQLGIGTAGAGEQLAAELAARGWWPEVSADLWIAGLAPLADLDVDTDQVTLSRDLDPAWAARCHRFAGREPLPHERAVLCGGPGVWFASVPGAPGEPAAAIGRCVVDGRWAGYTAVEVAPARRRNKLASATMAALARRALADGASAAYLEVETDNTAAQALYLGMGFARHHTYQHWLPPQE